MLKSCPACVDVTDLQFKLQCRLKVFENKDIAPFSNPCNILSCASRYGLLFVGTNSNNFQVIQTKSFYDYTSKDKDVKDYLRRTIEIPSNATHLCVNCDSTILAVILEKELCPVVIFYDVVSFLSDEVIIIKEIRLSATQKVYIKEINWNPSLPAIFTACKSDGSLGIYELKGEAVEIKELPVAAGVTCFCWSPKGKQIAVGSRDGKITQYKPDLKPVKVITEPKFEGPHTIISLQWVSNYQFIGVYQSIKDNGSFLIVVDAPKTGDPTFTNYEDICCSGSFRPPHFYLILQQTWNFLMVASANSTEVSVLANSGDQWTQWILSDTGRAELPLSADYEETLPVGLTFDISSVKSLPWGESSIPPCPVLCMVSHQGTLCCFNVVYLKEGVPSVCSPPDSVNDTSGLSHFIRESSDQSEIIKQQTSQQHSVKPQALFNPSSISSNSSPFSTSNVSLNMPSQSTPLMTSRQPINIGSKTLFGGSQTTLTPIKSQQPAQGIPLFGGQAIITPVSKISNSNTVATSAPSSQSTNFNEKYNSIFSSLNSNYQSQSNSSPVKPIVINATTVKPEIIAKPASGNILKQQDQAPEQIEVIKPPTTETKKSNMTSKADSEIMLSQLIIDNWVILDHEVKLLLRIWQGIKTNVGIDQEKVDMVQQIESLQEFVKDAVETSVGQSNEIHFLKQNLVQSWAWFEEAKSHHTSSKNEAIELLNKLQPLDSLSQKRLRDVEQLIYYVESQLSQANKAVDEQWDNFQEYAKKTYKTKMPTMEAIFQTMVKHNAILQKQPYVLKDISMNIKKQTSALLSSLDREHSLADDFQGLRLDSQTILQLQYEKIKSYSDNLSQVKVRKLRSLLKKREVTRVQAVKVQLSSWTINQSPISTEKNSVSTLGKPLSPSIKTSSSGSLNFSHASPIKFPGSPKDVTEKTISDPPSAAHLIQGSFMPVVRSGPVISTSHTSAFIPIGYSATSVATSEKQSLFKTVDSSDNQQKLVSTPAAFATGLSKHPSVSSLTSILPMKATNFTTSSFAATAVSSLETKRDDPITMDPSVRKTTSGTGSEVSQIISSSALTMSMSVPTTASELKPTFEFTFKPSSTNTFSFDAPNVVPKNLFGTLVSSSDPTSVNQVNKEDGSSSTGIQTKFSFGKTKTTSNLINTASVVSKQNATSIFSNSESMIANATTTAQEDHLKSNILTSTVVTTTTQSIFGPVPSSTSTMSPLFGKYTGNLFGSIPKVGAFNPAETSPMTKSIYEKSAKIVDPSEVEPIAYDINQTSQASTTSQSIELKTSVDNSFPSESSTSNIISVSLFGPKTTSEPASIISSSVSEDVKTPPKSKTFGMQDDQAVSSFTSNETVNDHISSLPAATDAETSLKFESVSVLGSKLTLNDVSVTPDISKSSESSKPSLFGSFTSPNLTTQVTRMTTNVFATNTTTADPSILDSTAEAGSTDIFNPAEINNGTTQSVPCTTITGNAGIEEAVSDAEPDITTNTAFGTAASSKNIFESPGNVIVSSAASMGGEIIVGKSSSVFGTSNATDVASDDKEVSTNIFRTAAVPTNTFAVSSSGTDIETSKSSAFGSNRGGSIFGTIPASSGENIFSSVASTKQPFGTPTATASIFSSTVSPTSTSLQTPAFGTPTTSSLNIFASKVTAESASHSSPSETIFATTAPSTTTSLFSAATNAASTFTSQPGSLFGSIPNTTGISFGQAIKFGTGSIFGGVQATTSASVFAQNTVGATSSFGTTTASATTNTVFGSAVSSSAGFGSTFGTSTTTNAFGSTAAPQQSNSFGFADLNMGGTSSSGSIFGGSAAGGSFGQPASATPFGKSVIFGPSSSNIFNNPTSTSSSTSLFGSPASTSSSIFGTNNTGGITASPGGAFGSSGTFGALFGQKATFGQSTFGGSAFGSPQPAAGPFSGGTGASPVAQSGFGSPASFQKPSGFGGTGSIFGSPAPAFGASPAFGGGSVFGSSGTFGSPEKVFGANQPAGGGFAQAAQQTTGFGNLATQNTIGFGNLAQQANTPTTMPFSGNSSFSSWR